MSPSSATSRLSEARLASPAARRSQETIPRWSCIIVDEAHNLKNEAGGLHRSLSRMSANFRMLLTGTPLQNNLHELWAMLHFLLPDIFTS